MFQSRELNINELKECIINKSILLEDGEIREFDLIDFFLMSKDDYITFLDKAKPICNKMEFCTLKSFFQRLNKRQFGALKYTTPTVLSRIDYVYKDYCLSLEEKEEIINFLQKNNIPILELTYFCAAKKYINYIIKNSNYKKERNIKRRSKQK